MADDDHVPATPPPKRSRRRRVADLSGLAQAWENEKDVRKGSRKRKCLLQWKDPTKVGLTGVSSLKENWKVILHLINIYCPDSPPSKTVPVDDVKPEAAWVHTSGLFFADSGEVLPWNIAASSILELSRFRSSTRRLKWPPNRGWFTVRAIR